VITVARQHVEHAHRYEPGQGGVKVEVERNSRGYTWRLVVDRSRREGESYADAFKAAQDEIAAANEAMVGMFGSTGEALTPAA
jgi:hypothetical protein